MSQAEVAERHPQPTPVPADREQAQPAPRVDARAQTSYVESELLVEDVSIDGMCGVY